MINNNIIDWDWNEDLERDNLDFNSDEYISCPNCLELLPQDFALTTINDNDYFYCHKCNLFVVDYYLIDVLYH